VAYIGILEIFYLLSSKRKRTSLSSTMPKPWT